MNFWKVILATLVIFGTGFFTGALVVNQLRPIPVAAAPVSDVPAPASTPAGALWPKVSNKLPPENTASWNLLRNDFIRRFKDQLALTTDQTAHIEGIISDSQKRTKEISDRMGPQLREEVRHARELIRAELSADQRKQFDDLMKARNNRRIQDGPAGKGTKNTALTDNTSPGPE